MSGQSTTSAATAPTPASSQAASPHWRRRLPAIVVTTVFVVLALRFFQLISRYAVNIFFSDQWDFNNATLFQPHSLWEMFRWQHGPPRLGLGTVLSHLIEPQFHWDSRTESFLIGGLIVITTLVAIWLKKRVCGALTLADVCIPLIFFTPLQGGMIFVVANWAHGPLPLFLIVLYCLCWTISSVPWRYSLLLAVNFVMIYTGFGLFLGVITPLALVADYVLTVRHLQRGRVYFTAALLVSLLSFASYFVEYVYNPAVGCKPNVFESPEIYLQFILLMFANLVGAKGLTGFPVWAGAGLVGWLLWALAVNWRGLRAGEHAPTPPYFVAAILIVFPLVFSAIAAYGRSCLGLAEAQVSRYVMYLEPALLGLYFSLLMLPRRWLRPTALALLMAILAATVPIRSGEQATLEYYRQLKQDWKACYLKLEDIAACDTLTGRSIYAPSLDSTLKDRLDYLKRTRQNLYADTR